MAPRKNYYSKATNITEKRVTRNDAKADPSLLPDMEEKEPKSILKRQKQRQYSVPWMAIVVSELESGDPTISRKKARREAMRIIKEASEDDRKRWRDMAQLPKKKKDLDWGVVEVYLISPNP